MLVTISGFIMPLATQHLLRNKEVVRLWLVRRGICNYKEITLFVEIPRDLPSVFVRERLSELTNERIWVPVVRLWPTSKVQVYMGLGNFIVVPLEGDALSTMVCSV